MTQSDHSSGDPTATDVTTATSRREKTDAEGQGRVAYLSPETEVVKNMVATCGAFGKALYFLD
jgi:hypothetical protein